MVPSRSMARPRPPVPDLLYIHTDQHNPFVTGCYGDAVVDTPHLDGLAAAGTVFDAAYCTSPICVPSRMSMLTGRHPHQNGVWTNDHMLPSDTPTIAHAMGAVGHRPVLIGRMHSVGPDQLHGYAERLVGDHAANFIGGVAHDMGALSGTAGPERISLRHAGAGQSPYQVHDEYVAAATVDYLNRIGVMRRAGEEAPFCLSVGLMLPHPPYVARRQDFDRYAGRVPPPHHQEPFSERLHPYIRAWRSATGIEAVGAAEQERARAAYWGLVTRVDELIGQMLAALDANGLRERCLVVYTSDHGDMVGEHSLWWKHVFYEESVRVPLIVSWPGVVAAGKRCGNVVSAVDVAATLVDAMGGPPLPGSPGRSLLPLIRNEDAGAPSAEAWTDEAFAEYCADRYVPSEPVFQRMVRSGRWKLVHYCGEHPQLFDLHEDPHELRDRAGDPACADILAALTQRVLDGWDPEAIAGRLRDKEADNRLIEAWARTTRPADTHRWPLLPSMARLDEPNPGD